jgi:hypothetical protein
MARDVVDIALLRISVPNGPNIELQEVMTFDITETDPGAEAVKTMRRKRRSIGFKRGVPEFEVDLEVKPVNPPEVDYLDLEQKGTLFQMFYEENAGGKRFTLNDCLVTEVGKTFNAEGEATLTIKILVLDHIPEA